MNRRSFFGRALAAAVALVFPYKTATANPVGHGGMAGQVWGSTGHSFYDRRLSQELRFFAEPAAKIGSFFDSDRIILLDDLPEPTPHKKIILLNDPPERVTEWSIFGVDNKILVKTDTGWTANYD